jgi:hypothetical protein
MRQLEPFGWLIMIVQVEPLSLVRTSMREPLLLRPTATGSSLKRFDSSFRISGLEPHRGDPPLPPREWPTER